MDASVQGVDPRLGADRSGRELGGGAKIQAEKRKNRSVGGRKSMGRRKLKILVSEGAEKLKAAKIPSRARVNLLQKEASYKATAGGVRMANPPGKILNRLWTPGVR